MNSLIAVKKQTEVRAVQLCWADMDDVYGVLWEIINPYSLYKIGPEDVSDTCREHGPEYLALEVPTKDGVSVAVHGDYIIRTDEGDFSILHPKVFEKEYDIITELP